MAGRGLFLVKNSSRIKGILNKTTQRKTTFTYVPELLLRQSAVHLQSNHFPPAAEFSLKRGMFEAALLAREMFNEFTI